MYKPMKLEQMLQSSHQGRN